MFQKRKFRKIDFIVAGAQKSGTTALNRYFRQHQEIGMPNRKELHFFDNEEIFSKKRINYSSYTKAFDFGGTVLDHKTGALGVPLNVLIGWYSRPEWIQLVLHYGYVAAMLVVWRGALKRQKTALAAAGA